MPPPQIPKPVREPIKCPHCQNRFSIPGPQVERPVNMMRVSVIVATHERPIKCPGCKHFMVLAVVGANIEWQVGALDDDIARAVIQDEESRIILSDIAGLAGNGQRR